MKISKENSKSAFFLYYRTCILNDCNEANLLATTDGDGKSRYVYRVKEYHKKSFEHFHVNLMKGLQKHAINTSYLNSFLIYLY